MRAFLVAVTVALIPLLISCSTQENPRHVAPVIADDGEEALALRILDGDTIETNLGTVRLLGIDAPERGKCGFDSAFALLFHLVGQQEVTLVPDPAEGDRDSRDRLLRYVRRDGEDIGEMLIASGEALAYRTYPASLHAEYLAAEEEARAEGRGSLWGFCTE